MWCLISQPNSVVFEVRVDPKAIGQELLEEVCKYVNVRYESDYFGLKYENGKGEELWLNLRNPIDRQVSLHGHPSHLRLALRVKFWVPPHILQQESTRHQFYLHARLDLTERRLVADDWAAVARLVAFVAQAEGGDCAPSPMATSPTSDHQVAVRGLYALAGEIAAPLSGEPRPDNILHMVAAEHRKCLGMKSSSAEYWFLKYASELENFGEETFAVKPNGGDTVFGVGPHGITLYKGEERSADISFANITTTSYQKRTFKLEYLDVDAEKVQLNIKLDSSHVASSLYRAITEKHAFYSCETVRSAVTDQFVRDLKGTIVSIFNEDSTLGKKYVFDIRRTCREVYDSARRAIYQETTEHDIQSPQCGGSRDESKSSLEKYARVLEAMTCKICMDNQMNALFLPCSHLVACIVCAQKCDRCPVCRSDITQAQKVYLPIEVRQLVVSNMQTATA